MLCRCHCATGGGTAKEHVQLLMTLQLMVLQLITGIEGVTRFKGIAIR